MTLALHALTADRFEQWRTATAVRIARLNRDSGMHAGADASAFAEELLAGVLPEGHSTRSARILTIADDEGERGTVWLRLDERHLFVLDLDFALRTAAEADELFAALREIAVNANVAKIVVTACAADAGVRELIEGRGFRRASIQMLLEPVPEREVPAELEVVPMTAERFAAFTAHSEAAFAQDLVASGRYTEEEAVAESHRQMQLELPDGLATERQLLFTATVRGAEIGVLWLGVRTRDGAPHLFVLDIEVAEGQQRRGYGRALMLAAEREARNLATDSIGLHVFGFNDGAIALYEGLGYRTAEERFILDL